VIARQLFLEIGLEANEIDRDCRDQRDDAERAENGGAVREQPRFKGAGEFS